MLVHMQQTLFVFAHQKATWDEHLDIAPNLVKLEFDQLFLFLIFLIRLL